MAMSSRNGTGANAGKKPGRALPGVVSYVVIIVVTVVASFIAAITLGMVLRNRADVKSSRDERDSLLEIAKVSEVNISRPKSGVSPSETPDTYLSAFAAEMREINPDYVFWISMADTPVDYPVVRGSDNEKYLNMSFSGERNMLGALFLDCRCERSGVPNIIIYGHNSKEGDMFGSLRQLLDGQYLGDHPTITLKYDDRVAEFEIFSARATDVYDPAYFLDFSEADSFAAFLERCGAPADAEQIVTLSTCVSGNNADERVVVQGTLR